MTNALLTTDACAASTASQGLVTSWTLAGSTTAYAGTLTTTDGYSITASMTWKVLTTDTTETTKCARPPGRRGGQGSGCSLALGEDGTGYHGQPRHERSFGPGKGTRRGPPHRRVDREYHQAHHWEPGPSDGLRIPGR